MSKPSKKRTFTETCDGYEPLVHGMSEYEILKKLRSSSIIKKTNSYDDINIHDQKEHERLCSMSNTRDTLTRSKTVPIIIQGDKPTTLHLYKFELLDISLNEIIGDASTSN